MSSKPPDWTDKQLEEIAKDLSANGYRALCVINGRTGVLALKDLGDRWEYDHVGFPYRTVVIKDLINNLTPRRFMP